MVPSRFRPRACPSPDLGRRTTTTATAREEVCCTTSPCGSGPMAARARHGTSPCRRTRALRRHPTTRSCMRQARQTARSTACTCGPSCARLKAQRTTAAAAARLHRPTVTIRPRPRLPHRPRAGRSLSFAAGSRALASLLSSPPPQAASTTPANQAASRARRANSTTSSGAAPAPSTAEGTAARTAITRARARSTSHLAPPQRQPPPTRVDRVLGLLTRRRTTTAAATSSSDEGDHQTTQGWQEMSPREEEQEEQERSSTWLSLTTRSAPGTRQRSHTLGILTQDHQRARELAVPGPHTSSSEAQAGDRAPDQQRQQQQQMGSRRPRRRSFTKGVTPPADPSTSTSSSRRKED